MQSRRVAFGLFLSLISVAIALLTGEVLLRLLHPQVTPDQYVERYRIDGKGSFAAGYYTRDAILPYGLKAGFMHWIADLAWYPLSVEVSLDRHGYRNPPETDSASETVFVGDSVVFGYGVEQSDALPAQLGHLTNQTVYSLGIPGAGPASYMVMLERYLDSGAQPLLILLGWFGGNDPQDLRGSSWGELSTCEAPQSQIRRQDSPLEFTPYPNWLLTSFLKHSHLATFLADWGSGREMSPAELAQIHKLSSEVALGALKMQNPTRAELEAATKRALMYAEKLEQAACVTDAERLLLGEYRERIRAGDFQAAYRLATTVSTRLSERGCSPIDQESFRNIVPYFHHYGGYYWHILGRRAPGPILNYESLIKVLLRHPEFGPWASALERILGGMQKRDPSIEVDIQQLNAELQERFAGPGDKDCDKEQLFLERVQSLAWESGSRLALISIPSEHQLRYYRDDKNYRKEKDAWCEQVRAAGVPCLELLPRITEHYQRHDQSLYLDGAHFNIRGNRLVAEWIAGWLDSHGLR